MQKERFFPVVALLYLAFGACQTPPGNTDWGHYLGDPSASHHSPLTQINVQNVAGLKEVWHYHSGGADSADRSQIQCNPLIINGILYGSSPDLKYFALNAATGEKVWEFDPFQGGYNQFGMGVNRGLAFWKSGEESRILCTASDKLYALDAKTGQPLPSFGVNGSVDLHTGLGDRAARLYVVSNTPGVVYQDLYILGTRVSEGSDAAPGYVR
ncbi:MAG: pyrroloquinoline quinone-dependent dehydrogenase, partial [Bacteroidetes bacterium]